MQPFVLAISGSPSPVSKTALFADHVLADLARHGIVTEHLRIRDIPPEALLRGDVADPALAHFIERFGCADGVVVATPIFKAACSGLLKSALDILPQFGLAGKAVLPIATGGSLAHVLALDYSLRPILQSMGARHIVQSVFLPEPAIVPDPDTFRIDEGAQVTLNCALRDFRATLRTGEGARLLGHPRLSAA